MKEENRQPEVITEENAPAGKKKKKLDVWIDIIIIAVLALAVAYAANRDRHKDGDVVQKEMLQYLEERYGEEFELVENSYRGTDYAHSFVSAQARPKTFPDEQHTFQIQGYFKRWGGLEYFDGYVMVKLTEEYEAYVDGIIGQYFDEYKFYMEFQSEWITNNLPPDTKVEDLKNYSANVDYPLPTLYIYVSPEKSMDEEMVKKVSNALKDVNFRGHICYWFLQSKERYSKLSRNDWGDNRTYYDYDDTRSVFVYDNKIEID